MALCDFCSAPEVCWSFPIDAITPSLSADVLLAHVAPGVSWHACQTCYLLVRENRWDALLGRALRTLPHHFESKRPPMREFILAAHEAFRRARNGPAQRVEWTDG